MMVYRLLSCLYVLCVIALLTFWSVHGDCIFFLCLVSYIFYIVHVEYIQFYSPVQKTGELPRRKHTRRKFVKLSLSYSYRGHWQCRPPVWNMPANCKGVTEHTVDIYEVCLFVHW